MPAKTNIDYQRSEPIQDIVDRMPTKFGFYTTLIIFGLFSVLLLFGWIVKYPDAIEGSIVINAKTTAVKLVTNSSGNLRLLNNLHQRDSVKADDYLAVIQNPADINDIKTVVLLVNRYKIKASQNDIVFAYPLFPTKVSLGEVNVKYFAFLGALEQLYNYKSKNVLEKQEENLQNEIIELTDLSNNNNSLMLTRKRNMEFAKKIADRDSILFAQKVSAEEDADHSKIGFLNSKESFQSIQNDIKNISKQINDDHSKLQQLSIQKGDKEKQLQLDMLSAYDALQESIKEWEQHYVLKAPINGILEYSKFWHDNQFVPSGEEIFDIIPKENEIIGQLQLPSAGIGKVNIGQEVIIKLSNYPFEEYGSVKGIVSTISLISNIQKQNNQENDIYLVDVKLPNGLVTNYGSRLPFKYEIKGTAEIISKDRRLFQRLFDNLRHATQKDKPVYK